MRFALRGSTLLELIVTLAIMAIVYGLAALALRAPESAAGSKNPVTDALNRAARARTPVTIEVTKGGRVAEITVLPDGQVIADSALHFDRLAGRQSDGR